MTTTATLLLIGSFATLALIAVSALLYAAQQTRQVARLSDDLAQANRRITLYRTDATQLRMFINARFNVEDEPRADL